MCSKHSIKIIFWRIVLFAFMPVVTKIINREFLRPMVNEIVHNEIRVWGNRERVRIASNAIMVNTLFNTSSGYIEVGDYTFTGHNVSMITGTHDYTEFLKERVDAFPTTGRDITIGRGVWIGSNAVILGPCTIADHAVVGACSVVLPGTVISAGEIFVGVPAKLVKKIDISSLEV